jgi:acyl-CoA synthetase (AMP-forming)/AMP-acid ligase II
MTTHENFLTTTETVIRCRELSRDPKVSNATLISVPLFHVTGCNSQFRTQIALGGTSVIMPRFDPASFLAAVPEYGITLITSVPTIYELVLRHPHLATTDVSSVRTLSYGGASITPELVHRLKAAFPDAPLGNGFGLSETSALATFLPHEYAFEHADAVGFASPVKQPRRRERVQRRGGERPGRAPGRARGRGRRCPGPGDGGEDRRRRPAEARGDRGGARAVAVRLRSRVAGRLQGPAVRGGARRSPAPQRRRQGAQVASPPAEGWVAVPR